MLMQNLQDAGIPVAIATGSDLSSYKQKISKHTEFFSGISHAVCSDDPDVKEGKPSPYIFQVAAARFKDPPSSSAKVRASNLRSICQLRSKKQPVNTIIHKCP